MCKRAGFGTATIFETIGLILFALLIIIGAIQEAVAVVIGDIKELIHAL